MPVVRTKRKGNSRRCRTGSAVRPPTRPVVDWHDFIQADPAVLVGKPVVKGTRLAVDFILGLFAHGWALEDVLANYPRLTPEAVQAVFGFASECLREEALFDLPASTRSAE